MTSRDLAPRDAELIAAFIDKRLSEDERKAFLERVDKDEALYEVFVETVRYRDQASAEGGKVLESTVRGRKWTVLSAVAALIAVAVATPVLLRNLSGESYAEELVADGRLEPYLEEGWYEQDWSVTRGGTHSTAKEASTAFRLGVRTVDLEIASRTGRREDAVILTHRIEELLHEVEFSEPLRAAYLDLRKVLGSGGARADELAELAQSAEKLARVYLSPFERHYALGQWTEIGRLGVQSGNREVLRARSFVRELDSLQREKWTPTVEANLAEIHEILEATTQGHDFEKLEASFDRLLSEG